MCSTCDLENQPAMLKVKVAKGEKTGSAAFSNRHLEHHLWRRDASEDDSLASLEWHAADLSEARKIC